MESGKIERSTPLPPNLPEVFEVSPAQSAERVASKAEVAKSDADAIRDAAEGLQGTWAALEADELELAYEGKGKEPGM